MSSTAQSRTLSTEEKLSSLSFAISLFNHCGFQCVHTSAYEKPQFTQIYIFVAIPCPPKESKDLQGWKNALMSYLKSTLQAERGHSDKTFPPFTHLQIIVYKYIFLYIYYIYIYLYSFIIPVAEWNPKRTIVLLFASHSQQSALDTFPYRNTVNGSPYYKLVCSFHKTQLIVQMQPYQRISKEI